LKVQIVSDEFFAWGLYGGFGFFARKLGGELVKRGIETEAIVHRISDEQKLVGETEVIDGVNVKTLPRGKLEKWTNQALYKTDADVIHVQSGRLDAWLSFHVNAKAVRIITHQDPMTPADIRRYLPYSITRDWKPAPWYKVPWLQAVESAYTRAVREATANFCQVHFMMDSIKREFGIDQVGFLPNFVDVRECLPKKSPTPMVVGVNRLDPIKRPEMWCQIAQRFPDVDFYLMGKSHHYGLDNLIRERYNMPNLHYVGFVTGEEKEKLLDKAWVLLNTAVHECLPVSFLEALAHGAAICSCNDPDQFTSRYGAWVRNKMRTNHIWNEDVTVDDFMPELKGLLEDGWKEKGEAGYSFVKGNYDTPKVVQKHLDIYGRLAEGGG